MPSAIALGAVPGHLQQSLSELDRAIPIGGRDALLARAFELRSGREKPNRFWKIDLDAIDFAAVRPAVMPPPQIRMPDGRGVLACDLQTALRDHSELVARALGSAVDRADSKFAALASALCNTGAFVYVQADAAPGGPVEIAYDARDALFPYTLVLLERGAECTVVERLRGHSNAFVAGISEVVAEEGARATYAALQNLPADARALFSRTARPGKDASCRWCVADLGASLTVETIETAVRSRGAQAEVTVLFFPTGDQHVDVISTVRHDVGESQSRTLVKSAAAGRGQARYLGNIRIAPHAQATDAALRDDALLLSKRAHIDSVPALEIAANDVKAYHGATVGALDEDQIFYMTSRGIERQQAETMIALGFFEPAIEHFPENALREEVRAALRAKVSA